MRLIQIKLLLWKNAILIKRKPVRTKNRIFSDNPITNMKIIQILKQSSRQTVS